MPRTIQEDYIDTNVVIESHRVSSWSALASGLSLATVDKVIEECATGGSRREGYAKIDIEQVKGHIQIYGVKEKELADLRLELAGRVNLDPGEEHLLAKAIAMAGSWRVCSPDSALVRACFILGYVDRVVSLESLLNQIGFRLTATLRRQYTEKWLSQKRTDLLLELG